MTLTIDLNADLGELPGDAGRASDRAILAHVTSCAIACGGHAGDEATMEATLLAARDNAVLAGAHPSYPDRKNFGRVRLSMSPSALQETLSEQMLQLSKIAAQHGIILAHVKPHGALYNDAAKSAQIAEIVARAIASCFGTELALIGPPGSETEAAARQFNLAFHPEGFMDRAYMPDGSLMPRGSPGAVLQETDARLRQACQIARDAQVTHCEGGTLAMPAKTLCLHGDSPGAAETARDVRAALERHGVSVRSVGNS